MKRERTHRLGDRHRRRHRLRGDLPDPVRLHPGHRGQDHARRRPTSTSAWPTAWQLWDNITTVLTVRQFVVLRAFINSTTLTVFSVAIMVVLVGHGRLRAAAAVVALERRWSTS